MTRLVPVQGTWSKSGGGFWWEHGSCWWDYMKRRDFEPALVNGMGFEWATDLGSSWQFWRHLWPGKRIVDSWYYAGRHLAMMAANMPYEDRRFVCHSHGGQVGLIAATFVEVRALLTVATPNRSDMEETTLAAKKNIGQWWHLLDPDRDWTATLGAVGDGRIRTDRRQWHADVNVYIPGMGHSELFRSPERFPDWESQRILDFLAA